MYPRCTAAQLAAFPFSHRTYGHVLPGIGLRNISLATCSVAGFPSVAAYDARGRRARLSVDRAPFLDTQPVTYAVAPSRAVFFALYGRPPKHRGDFSDCRQFQQIAVGVPDAGTPIRLPFSLATCGGRIAVSQIFPVNEL
ncbi:MAG: DUF4232 domain-containing protein [Candidatus Velthaea sp.]